jgi:hypothetical protein
MVKSSEIIKKQNSYHDNKTIHYEKIYKKIEKKILSSIKISPTINSITYVIPNIILGMSLNTIDNCKKYIINKLIEDNFKVTCFENILLIEW